MITPLDDMRELLAEAYNENPLEILAKETERYKRMVEEFWKQKSIT